MKTYRASYYLGTFYHTYLLDAENECSAIEKVIGTIPDASKKVFHNLKIERYFQEWN